ncbi:phosphopantothenoylcysteine decarboxylase [Bacteroidia bacterium]|nr:phosphopantothenoylcysteine decarboxylase [Bacteroidia bacterium]
MPLNGKHILLGITGSIAAYKAAMLARLLVREGASVRVVMTPLAREFITPLTMATLTRNPILVDFFDPENGAWNSHVSLGEWADCYLIAPATANTLAKMAHGVADNLLLTTYLSARCPVVAAPAMDLDMFAHPATQQNIGLLTRRGVLFVEPGEGELASGLSGKGRMAEPEQIVEYLRCNPSAVRDHAAANGAKTCISTTESCVSAGTSVVSEPCGVSNEDQDSANGVCDKSLAGRHIVVSAGATREAIDPVRYISNHSSGKMGYAIARALAVRGARVSLVSGPVDLPTPEGVERVDVVSAHEMYKAVVERFADADGAVMAAAVADYTPERTATSKLKKSGEHLTITLTPTVDIAAELGRTKGGKLLVGFALETDNEQANALDKLRRKNLDMIVLNSMRDLGAGFGVDTNKVTILCRDGSATPYPLMSKEKVAAIIADRMARFFA